MEDTTLVFNIQKYSVHDGPGIRTVVFLKGCPLRCRWCSNPESQSTHRSIFFKSMLCIGCGTCTRICPSGIAPGGQGTDPACTNCGKCAGVCPSGALEAMGNALQVREVLSDIEKDEIYYRKSGGGVTISGGEPLLHPDYVIELAREVKAMGYTVAMETTGFASADVVRRVFPELDLILFDVKNMDDKLHREFTGVSNRQILENLSWAASEGLNVIVRVPLLGGFNATEENIRKLADFMVERRLQKVNILPYHTMGEYKYKHLRMEYDPGVYRPEKTEIDHLVKILKDRGIDAVIDA